MLWAAAYFFFLLASYYSLRPLRETLGIRGGADDLSTRFLVTLAITIPASFLFSIVVSRLPRGRFIPIVYRFCAVNMVAFYLLLTYLPERGKVISGNIFYSWLSVYNVFVISVFWGFVADSFRGEQGKRLFGFIGVGGTLGAIAGAWFAKSFARGLGSETLLLAGIVFVELAVQSFRRMERLDARAKPPGEAAPSEAPPRKPEPARARERVSFQQRMRDSIEGFRLLLRSPYLLGVALVVVFLTATNTILYLYQGKVVDAATAEHDSRTVIFASLDLYGNIVALALQLLITARLIRWIGVGGTHAILPAASIVGFAALTRQPDLAVVAAFQIFRRGGDYGMAKPAREVLFTVVSPREKYLAKNVIDTFVYRGSDAFWAYLYAEYVTSTATLQTAITVVMIPLSVVWVVLALVLGRQFEKRSKEKQAQSAPSAAPAAH